MTEISQGLQNEAHVWSQVAAKLPDAVGARLLDDVQNDKTKLILENVAAAGIGLVLKRSPVAAATAMANVALLSLGYDALKIGASAWGADTDAQRQAASDSGSQLLASQAATMIESTPGLALGTLGTSALSKAIPSLSPYLESPSIKVAQNIELPLRARFSRTTGETTEPPAITGTSAPPVQEVVPKGGAAAAPVGEPKVITYNRGAFMGGEDQGLVYDNGNGTVTKVITDENLSAATLKHVHDTLKGIGVRVPTVLETGVTPDGQQAAIIQKIGDGEPLRTQIMTGQLSWQERVDVNKQWWQMADRINKSGYRVDFTAKNMTYTNNELWLFDPGFLRPGTMSDEFLHLMAGNAIGPRP